MLRTESESGWWLIAHAEHARLAGAFAAEWGNLQFRKPEPRERVAYGISAHDDGWIARDEHPFITREGKPAAFSVERIGKASALEGVDLEEYLTAQEKAVRAVAEADPYAALLVSMHIYSLLTEHPDPSWTSPRALLLLDSFLHRQRLYQSQLDARIAADISLTAEGKSGDRIVENFRLLQACDHLSLLASVGFGSPSHLLYPMPLHDGSVKEVQVFPLAPRHFRLSPWPFSQKELSFFLAARHVGRKFFATSGQLEEAYLSAGEKTLTVTLVK